MGLEDIFANSLEDTSILEAQLVTRTSNGIGDPGTKARVC